MTETNYQRVLDVDVRMRATFITEKTEVKSFRVQLEVLVEGKWREVMRYNTAHGFAHRDFYYPDGSINKVDLKMTFKNALTYALIDIRDNWEKYRNNFLRGLK